MVDDAQQKILRNAEALLLSAQTLFEHELLPPAAHLATICLEECSKFVITLDGVRQLFGPKAQYSHQQKEEVLGLFHYLSGKLSVVYLIQRASDSGLLGGSAADKELVLSDLLNFSGVSGRDSLVENVKEYMARSKTWPQASRAKNDSLRKRAVYCDTIDGHLVTPQDAVTHSEIVEVIEDAALAVSILRATVHNEFNLENFAKSHLNRFEDVEARAQEMISSVKAARLAKNE